MYCVKCGTQLPDDARFCLECGTPQRATVGDPEVGPRWETCEIRMVEVESGSRAPWFLRGGLLEKKFDTYKRGWQFVVPAIGPHGHYDAATSPFWSWGADGSAVHAALVKQLAEDGWDHMPRESTAEWFNLRFRRRVT